MNSPPEGGIFGFAWAPSAARLAKVGLGLCLLSLASSVINQVSISQGGVSVIWLPNGLLIGVLLCSPRKQWVTFISLAYLIDCGVNLAGRNSLGLSFYFAACNMVEAIVAASLTCRVVSPNPDLTEARQLRTMLLYGVLLAPTITALLACLGLRYWTDTPLSHAMQYWFAADVLGIATALPLYLSFHLGSRFSRRSMDEVFCLFILLCAVSVAVFGFCPYPMLWLVLLCLILLGVRLGFTGSALGLLVVTFIGGFGMLAGHGPIAAVAGVSTSRKILIFQFFIGTSMLALYVTEVAMTANRKMRAGLEASETRFRLLTEASRDVIVLAGLDGNRQYVSPAVTELLGWNQEDLVGKDYTQITHPDDLPRMRQLLRDCRDGKETGSLSYQSRKKDGSYLWLESNIRLCRDTDTGEPIGFVYVLRDISERKMAEEKLQFAFETAEQLARVDGLTGVANRRLLDNTLQREWSRAVRNHSAISLLLIDVDYFKLYNDIYGHLAGDGCLQRIAKSIKGVLRRPTDLVARYGGEEFVIVLPNTPSDGAEIVARRVMEAVDACNILHERNPFGKATISLGCATHYPSLETGSEALIRAADSAMYRAKAAGRNQFQIAMEHETEPIANEAQVG
jgi:diguanylate cyclase (GGDEF)-like protein/PAS domain S-box-containing protein